MRILQRVILALLTIATVIGASGFFLMRHSFPYVNGTLHVAGLKAPVDVYRDAYGVPHIYARNQHDLFFAQGYVHAQDRFWQMDFWRHLGSARLSEMFGESQLPTDRFLRTLGWARVVREELQQYDKVSLSILNAYSEGVNSYLADHSGSSLSLEYVFLKALNRKYKPEPWQPLHTLTWAKAMAWDLASNMNSEIRRSLLLKTLTREQVEELYPSYPADHPYILPGSASAQNPKTYPDTQLLGELSQQFARLDSLIGPVREGIGSNNWVISGSLTDTGKPILANDPHLGSQMPSIWYEVDLHCEPKSDDCPYEIEGVSFAGVPGIIIGHNDKIAWGFTNVGPDVMDLYIEKINPNNPNQYEVNGQWKDMKSVQETIRVAGGKEVPITVRYTRHGPVISDTYSMLEGFRMRSGIELPERYAIALQWTALQYSNTFRAIWKANRAENWDEFREAASDFYVPSQNMVYADVEGNIGYQMPGKIPIRAGGDGRYPAPGWTDEYEWKGYIPFEELPFSLNPRSGYVVSANNPVRPDYPYLIASEWDYGYRAHRITEMIEQHKGPISIADVQVMQGDNTNEIAKDVIPLLLQFGWDDFKLRRAAQLFQNWDFQCSIDSAPAALFQSFWRHLLQDGFADDLPPEMPPRGDSRWYEVTRRLLQQSDSAWWDDAGTSAHETRNAVLRSAFREAVAELYATQGPDPQKWRWGAMHRVNFRNETMGSTGNHWVDDIFNRGPFETAGSGSLVNATSWDAAESYDVQDLPSMRMIVDLSDLSNSLAIHTTGQSGHAYHDHYIDMADLWRKIHYHPMLWNKGTVQSNAEGYLQLLP